MALATTAPVRAALEHKNPQSLRECARASPRTTTHLHRRARHAKRRRGREGEQGKKRRRERQRRGACIVYASANGRRRIADSRSPPPTRNGRAVGISPPPSGRDAFCPHICLSCLPQPCPRSPAILALLVTSSSPAHPEHGHRFHHHRTEVPGTTQIGLPTHLTAPDYSNFRRTLYASTILSYRH